MNHQRHDETEVSGQYFKFIHIVFEKSHSTALLEEDDRLERLNQTTRLWWDQMT